MVWYYRSTGADKKILNFIPLFVDNHEAPCGENLGTLEPLDYPANYMMDERKEVIDLENNVTHSEYESFLNIFFDNQFWILEYTTIAKQFE